MTYSTLHVRPRPDWAEPDAEATALVPAAAPALPLSVLLLVAALAAAAVAQGGYHRPGQLLAAAGILTGLALALRRAPLTITDARLIPVPAITALAGWAVLRAALAGSTGTGLPHAALLLGIVAVLLVCRRVPVALRGALADAVIAVGALVAVTAWVGVAARVTLWAWSHQSIWRAAATLTYANATAGLLAVLALVALARRVERTRSVLLAMACCLLLVGIGATLSRGGLVALAIGLAVLCWQLGVRRMALALAGPAIGAVVVLLGLAPSLPAADPARPGVATAALAAGLALSAALALLSPRVVVATAAVAVAGAALALPFLPVGFGSAVDSVTGTRLNISSAHRFDEAAAALRVAGEQPFLGAGPGQAVLSWRTEDGTLLVNRYVHNEYLQVLAELGGIGLLLLLIMLGLLARMVWRGRRAAGSPELWAGALAALAALAAHSAIDFLWHLPVIPLIGAVLAGLVTAPAGVRRSPPGGTGTRLGQHDGLAG